MEQIQTKTSAFWNKVWTFVPQCFCLFANFMRSVQGICGSWGLKQDWNFIWGNINKAKNHKTMSKTHVNKWCASARVTMWSNTRRLHVFGIQPAKIKERKEKLHLHQKSFISSFYNAILTSRIFEIIIIIIIMLCMDISDPLSPLLPIIHHLWQVFRATSCILT